MKITHLLRIAALSVLAAAGLQAGPFAPRGQVHIPIGIPDTRDTLKTFVEAEGNFSPGFGTFGAAFWVYDSEAQRFFAPTMDDVPHTRGLLAPGVLIPWTQWQAGSLTVRSEVCHVLHGDTHLVGSRLRLTNSSQASKQVTLYAAVTSLGAAGAPLQEIRIEGDTIFANREPALISATKPDGGEAPAPEASEAPLPIEKLPPNQAIIGTSGEASGALRFEVTLAAGESRTFGFVCPVLHGRRAAPHLWDGVSPWAQYDDADPLLGSQGERQPAPGVDYYRAIAPDTLFTEAEDYWRKFRGDVELDLPDPRWAEAFHAITAHAAMCLNDGAPDVAVINYNVFNRDGVYVGNIFQKAGNFELARKVIDYFLAHPFNGRVQPEADNPGQILWLIDEHWRFTRDRAWLEEVWPRTKRLAAMIEYYRTTPEPHWVSVSGIDFGEQVPDGDRMRLKPGACDGHHPEYTEAFDLAGLRAVAALADELNDTGLRDKLRPLIDQLAHEYDQHFLADLRKHPYANYCALWPCRLYPFGTAPVAGVTDLGSTPPAPSIDAPGYSASLFREVGAQATRSWRYFPLSLAHQGLLAGNREAAAGTLAQHLDLDMMRGWYALDEGGPSGPGNWGKVKTNWKVEAKGPNGAGSAVAMPHGWAIAELHLLLRDALVFEDGDKLVLFAGIPSEWFGKPMRIQHLPTHFGALDIEWKPADGKATLTIGGSALPPGGIVLRTPKGDSVYPKWSAPIEAPIPQP